MPTEITLITGERFVVTEAPDLVAQALDRRGPAIRFEQEVGGAVWINQSAVARFTEAESHGD